MRIIAGLAKGMPLTSPPAGVRPTTDRIRGAIFSSLAARIAGADVIDLFAGTGALGLEAASRGAQSVVFVENDRAALSCLEQNIESFRRNRAVSYELTIVQEDVFAWLASEQRRFSLVFADPPYGETAQRVLEAARLTQALASDGLLVLESARRTELTVPAVWRMVRDAVYGDTRVTFLAPSQRGDGHET